MKKILLLIVILAAAFFYFNPLSQLSKIEKGVSNVVEDAKKIISTPPPLRYSEERAGSALTAEGVIEYTNIQRAKRGLALLKENRILDSSAQIKAKDMFARQYFEHQSPTGEGVSDLADRVGYDFIVLGENLALGNFKDDQALVQAWMDSPGHRENILNNSYGEIGVSVIKGTFEGKTTWIAVQHFGLPQSACPQIDETLKARVELNEKRLRELEGELNSLKNRIKNVGQYNELVREYNNLVSQNKLLVDEYNRQVRTFNECLAEAGASE